MLLETTADIKAALKEYAPKATEEWHRLGLYEAYYDGLHRPPYEPETATREFRELVHRAVTNLMPLIIKTVTQRLVVDGFRASAVAVENAPQWDWWQANGLDSRQKSVYTEAGKHGYTGVMVLPGQYQSEEGKKDAPVMRPVSPREWWLGFEDYSDDWPSLCLKQTDDDVWHVLDERSRYVVRSSSEGDLVVLREDVHDLGVVPIVPFRATWCLTHYPDGEIGPSIAIQDRLNQTVFDLLVAQTYSAAPQKWAAGLSLPTDEKGRPITDIRAFAKSLWATNEKDAKFGSLPEANLNNIVKAIEQALRMYGLMTQTPPHYLLGDLINLSAEALLAADTSLANKAKERQMLFGEAWEQCFRLGGKAVGDATAANDLDAQVWWRDTEPRSIAQQVDALGKLATMLQVPVTALWEDVPGMTGGTLQRWRTEAARQRLELVRQGLAQRTQQAQQGQQALPAPGGTPGANIESKQAKADLVAGVI
jgi:Phage portal protein, SPP1 Gp6-like